MHTVIIGGGVTGMAAAIASGGTVLEKYAALGGLAACDTQGGYVLGYSGHWLFGGTPAGRRMMQGMALSRNTNKSTYALYGDKYIRAPIQNYIEELSDPPRIYAEIASRPSIDTQTFASYLRASYGNTLYRTFFLPFNEKYTCGLMHDVEPMHARNVVTTLESLLRGEKAQTYNEQFMYVVGGTQLLVNALATHCDSVICGADVAHVDIGRRVVTTRNGVEYRYDKLISTIPLVDFISMCGMPRIELPYLSSITVNVGCDVVNFPGQWVYVSGSDIGFHRIGNYTVVDKSLAPPGKHLVYLDVNMPKECLERAKSDATWLVSDAVDNGFIDDVEEWIDVRAIPVAYTFTMPGQRAEIARLLDLLASRDVFSIGGYGRWQYQGMMADIEEGFRVGSMIRRMKCVSYY